jgi:hypothetical protein
VGPSYVSKAISTAFPSRPPPSEREISDAGDDEGLRTFFAGRSWQGIAPSELRYHEVGLSLLTDQAFAYYLPAYMLAELTDSHIMDTVPEHIAYAFAHGQRDPAMFTELQRRAIAAFFLLMAAQNGGRHSRHSKLFLEATLLVRPPNYAFKRTAGTGHRVS